MTTVEKLHAAIEDFVHRPENSILRAATGSFSTPFRGSLFGQKDARDVDDALVDQRATVLFLGSNPNCPGSLDHLKARTQSEGHWPEFQEQRARGCFGHWDPDRQQAWDPLHNPLSMGPGQKTSWTFYANAIKSGVGSLDGVAFANVFSWGSGKLKLLLQHLRHHDVRLLNRVVAFANQQLSTIIRALRPQLVISPQSVSSNNLLKELLLSQQRCKYLMHFSVPGLTGRPYNIQRGKFNCDEVAQTVLLLPHPSALRFYRKADWPAIEIAISQAIARALAHEVR